MPTLSGSVQSRLQELEAQLGAYQESASRRRRRARRGIRVVTLLAILIAAPVALASDRFTDVPNSNSFHNQINLIAQAGITKGCNAPANTLYCPADPVRRDAMAAFLVRAAGRAAIDKFYSPTPVPGSAFASVQVKAEGDALLLVHGSGWFETRDGPTPAFPCYGAAYLALDGTAFADPSGAIGFGDHSAPGGATFELDFASAETAWVVPAGNHTVNLVYLGLDSGSCDIAIGSGSLTAMVVPFGGTGSSPFAEAPPPPAGPASGSTFLAKD